MTFEAGNIYFNRIYIIQSLRSGDKQTGQELFDDIINRRISNTLSAEVIDVGSKSELLQTLAIIKKNIYKNWLPFIHFETHGFEGGIQLNDNSEITWPELVPFFLEINLLTKNNLFVSMAACKGGNVQFCVKITEPCPFRGFIGPMDDVGEVDVLTSYTEFFNTLLLTDDFEQAIIALNTTAGNVKYHHMNVETFFEVAIEYNFKLEKENPNRMKERIDVITENILLRYPQLLDQTGLREKIESEVINSFQDRASEMYDELKKRFCHID
jgi:hypothetical protein